MEDKAKLHADLAMTRQSGCMRGDVQAEEAGEGPPLVLLVDDDRQLRVFGSHSRAHRHRLEGKLSSSVCGGGLACRALRKALSAAGDRLVANDGVASQDAVMMQGCRHKV